MVTKTFGYSNSMIQTIDCVLNGPICIIIPAWRQEMDLMIFVGPFQLGIFYDSFSIKYIWYYLSLPQCSAWSSAHWLFIWLSLSTMYFHRIRTTFLLCPLLSVWYVPLHLFLPLKNWSMRKYTSYYASILFCLNGN